MTQDEYIEGFYRLRGMRWEAHRAWEYVQLHGDPFQFFNLPSLRLPTCSLRCLRCKTQIEIDFVVIRHVEVYDYDCEHCHACNCFSSIAAIIKLDRFRERGEKYQRAWQRRVYGDDNDDRKRPRRSSISSKLRWQVLHRDNFKCQYCGVMPGESELHIDHVLSKADGGNDTFNNLVTACVPCNLGKGSESVWKSFVPRYLPSMDD